MSSTYGVMAGREVVEAHPELERFVRDPTALGIPDRYRLFLAVTPGPAARTTGLCMKAISSGEFYLAAGAVYPPFAYALTFNGSAI